MRSVLGLAAVMAASVAIAHTEVKNPTVLKRMEVMKSSQEAMKVLGDMARGKTAFDVGKAEAAQEGLVAAAAKTLTVFEPEEDDPASEAKPEIWTQWDDFTEKSVMAEVAAEALKPSSLETLRAGMGPIGKSCSACHEVYRIKK